MSKWWIILIPTLGDSDKLMRTIFSLQSYEHTTRRFTYCNIPNLVLVKTRRDERKEKKAKDE